MTESTLKTSASSGSLFENIVDVFVNPARLFDRVRNQSFVMPAIVLTLIGLVFALAFRNLTQPFVDAEVQLGLQRAAASGQAVPENARAMAEKFATYSAIGGPIILPWIVALFGGLITFIAARIVGAKITFGQAATISVWGYFPMVLASIVSAIIGLMMDPSSIRSAADGQIGVARFLDPTTTAPIVRQLALQFEVFNLWTYVLYAIGISVIARAERSTGFLATLIRLAIVVALSSLGGLTGR